MTGTIPFDKLYVSSRNVRKTNPDFDVEIFAQDLKARGLLQNLVVIDEGNDDGMLGIVAGGRRYRALAWLDARGEWPEAVDRGAIPIELRPAEEGRADSLAEAVQKVSLNVADEIEAYRDVVDDYRRLGLEDPVGRLARHFGKTVRQVEQTLRLADLAPDIIAALRAGRISLDVAKAYARVPDQALQLAAFAAQERQERHSVDSIRAIYAGRTYRTCDPWVVYVGVEEYRAAGGRIDRDLFMAAAGDDEVLLDTALLDRLLRERAEPEADRIARELGYRAGALENWGPESHVLPRPPAGFRFVPAGATRASDLPRPARADAVLICRLARDGSRLVPGDHIFRPSEATKLPAAPGQPPAAAGTVERLGLVRPAAEPIPTAAELAADRRRVAIEARALKLALPSFAGTPFEGRAFWPPDPATPVPPIGADADGNYLVVLQVIVPKAAVAAVLDEAEWQLVEEETEAAKETKGDAIPADGEAAAVERKPATAAEFADFIEKRLERQPKVSGLGVNWEEHRKFARALVRELVEQHGARYRESGGSHYLTLAGVSRSCTAGEPALLTAWVYKAREAAPAELEPAL